MILLNNRKRISFTENLCSRKDTNAISTDSRVCARGHIYAATLSRHVLVGFAQISTYTIIAVGC